MGKHSTSAMMLAGAIAFYLIFGLIIPNTMYADPATATGGVEHASVGLGQILRKFTLFIAGILGLFAGARFIKELRS